jgi:hypothetical protein
MTPDNRFGAHPRMTLAMKAVYEIDGRDSSTLEEFAEDFTRRLNLQTNWHRNLDGLNDILHGGFGTPDEGFEAKPYRTSGGKAA